MHKMTLPDPILRTDVFDVLLTPVPYGWSDLHLHIAEKHFHYFITHIFNDPYADLIQSLLDLAAGKNESEFTWHEEPGGCTFRTNKVQDQHHKIKVSLYEFNELCGCIPDYRLACCFEIRTKQWIIIFYLQLKKIFLLFQDKHFAQPRGGEEFLRTFHSFEMAVLKYINK